MLVSIKIITAALISLLICSNGASANELLLGDKSKINGVVNIPIVAPADFNFKPKAEIFLLRTAEVLKHKELLQGNYQPSDAVFGFIVDKKPWWGLLGEAYYGPGQNSIIGLSQQSRFILNPFLLAGEESVWHLDKSRVTEQDLRSHYYPTFIQPSGLKWWPKEGKAEVTYQVTAFKSEMCRIFNYPYYDLNGGFYLQATNARDLGLNYFYIPTQWAYNFNIVHPMRTPQSIPQLFHCGGSCGYPGGCNNMSPAFDPLSDFRPTRLPARLVILFWKKPPVTGRERADMTYTINFN